MKHTTIGLAAAAAIAVTGIAQTRNTVVRGHSLAPVELVLERG